MVRKYIVELEEGMWLRYSGGNPDATLRFGLAQLFDTRADALRALRQARESRPFPHAIIDYVNVELGEE